MDNKSILDTIEDSFLNLIDQAVDYIPNILAALILFLIGLIVSGYIGKLAGKLISFIEKNKTVNNIADILNIKMVDFSEIIALITRWAILLIFINASIDALGINVLTDTFNQIIGFLPNIFAAVVVAMIAIIAGNVVYDIVQESCKKAGIRAYTFLATTARVVILIFGIPLAAAQLGLDLTIINNNITVIVAGIMLAFGLAFGFGGRDTAGKIVDDFYKNWKK